MCEGCGTHGAVSMEMAAQWTRIIQWPSRIRGLKELTLHPTQFPWITDKKIIQGVGDKSLLSRSCLWLWIRLTSRPQGEAKLMWTTCSAPLWGQVLIQKDEVEPQYPLKCEGMKNPKTYTVYTNLMSLSTDTNVKKVQSSVKWHVYMLNFQVIRVYYVHWVCLQHCMCWHMLGEFSSRAALKQQSHKQTAILSRESTIRLCRTASVLQQAINTESIIAPSGASGQGGQERHHLKGQCLERKQEGQSMMEAQGWKRGRQGGGWELP